MVLKKTLERFRSGEELPEGETAQFFDALLAETDESLIADVLTAWNEKSATENEIFNIASIMRERCVKVNSDHADLIDVVGTGGSRIKTFNVSTAAAFVTAGAGVAVAKHGNRAASSSSGSADVLSALGVNTAVDKSVAERCLRDIGICFMFAPMFHSLSPVLGKVRRGLGAPTIFNNLGPLCNPASAPYQLIGVWHRDMVEKIARVLARLGTKRTWIVHGSDGLDEITLNGPTFVSEVSDDKVRSFTITPSDFGVKESEINGLRTSDPEQSASMIRSILDNRRTNRVAFDLVLVNAAASIYLSGRAESLKDAAMMARQSIESGAARRKLDQLINATGV